MLDDPDDLDIARGVGTGFLSAIGISIALGLSFAAILSLFGS